MRERSFSPVLRFLACLILVFATLASLAPLFGAGAKTQGPIGPKIWMQDSQPLAVTYTGAGASGAIAPVGVDIAAPEPVAMAQGDFDQDGVGDLAVGYSAGGGGLIAIHRGNLDAFAPRTAAAFQAIAHNQFLSPFLPEAQTFAVPESPDFVVAGDFTGYGHTDLAIASRGGSTLYIFSGDGKGNFRAGSTIPLPGGVTSLAAGVLGRVQQFSNLLVGVSSRQQTFLAVYGAGQQGFGPLAAFPLSAPATSISFGDFGDIGPDAAFLSGGQLVLLHSSSMRLETLSLPIHASAMALGSFVYDRNPGMQIALLDTNGNLAIAAHNEFDPHARTQDEMRAIRQLMRSGQNSPLIPRRVVATHGWQIVEIVPSAAPYSSSQPPVLFRTRISGHGADDVMVLNASQGQMALIAHPDPVAGANMMLPAQVSTRPYSGSPVAAISARVNVDGRPGVLALHQGEMAPRVIMPLPDPTFTVNRTDDPTPVSPIANACNGVANDCSLREAILRANSIAGTDTIMVPAGTYTLTIAKVADDCTGNFGALSVNDSATIVGAGQATTIIQAGATQATGVDMVMNVNEDLGTANCPITNASASISNLTIQNGHNRGTHGNDGDGGCMEFDTGSSGNTTLSLTNVTLNNCTTTQGNGGGIAIFNFTNPGTGAVTASNSIFQNNSAVDSVSVGTAGGIWVSELGGLTMSNSQVINNLATQVNGTDVGTGGGITTTSNVSGSPQVVIHSSTISGNQAAGNGGGMDVGTNLLIDQESVISNNSAGTAHVVNETSGGAFFMDLVAPDSVALTKVTITGNSTTGTGGGIFNGSNSGGGGLTIRFSRLAGNTAGTPGSNNLNNDDTTISAINNWWGTNTPASTINNANGGTTTFDPFIVLTHTAAPNKIKINQSSTLTGDMSKDNHGSGVALAGNLDVLNGLPITFNNAVLGSIPQTQPEMLDAGAQATATYNAGGVGGNGSADATVDQQTVTASIIVLQPPSITKSFNPVTVAVNAPSTITFSVTNGNTVAINGSFVDALPAGLVVATTPNVVNGCGGSVTAIAGSGSISFTNAALAVGTCNITVNVQSATDNVYNNSVTIDSTDAGNGNTASASVTVINPPTIAKAFGAATIPLNGTTSLTFTLTSTNVNLTLNGVAFTDSLPAGLVVATPSNLSSTCTGTATATAGSGSVSLTGATLAPVASCTVSVNVTGTTPGVKNNSVTVSSTNGGTGNTSNASITVVSPPVIIKAFGAASIPLNGSTSLTFTIQNNNTGTTLTGVGFSDTLPAGLVISTPNGLTGSCGGGTITATAASNVISLSGASLAANASCTFSVNVTGTAAGQQNNTTGNVTSTEGGTGGTASASINVVAPPSIAKVFNPNAIAVNATTTLTFTITNPAANTVAQSGVAFTDTLPTGLVVATPNGLTNSCGGTATAVAGSTSISLTGGSIAVNTSCMVVVNVTGTASGQYTNTSGAVSSTNGGTGNTASANLTVASPPTITKAFGAASIPLNGTTSLTFSIQNPNSGLALTGVAFTDNLPAGLVIATPANLSSTCGGTATAVSGSGQVSLSAGTLAASASCTVSVNVTGTTAGVKNNSVQVTSTEGGTGNTSNASITVISPPVIIKAFGAASIPLNGSTSLTFTIQNNNPTSTLTGVGFSDTLPAGLVVSTPNGLTGSCGGGTITATAGSNVISLSGASLAASSSCTFSVNVTGVAAGQQNNTTGNVTSTEGGTGGTASASIIVVAPPSIAKAFGPATIPLNGTTSLTITITNPAANAVAQTGVAFTDTLPAGIVVATPNGLTSTCGGTATAVAGSGSISLTGGTVATNSNCTVVVNVTGTASGQFTNTTGAVTSANGGTGNTASANLTVASAPTIAKAFGVASIPLNGTTSLTFNIQNPNSGLALTGVAFTDNLPAGLVIATPNNLNNTCGGTATAVSGSGQVSLSAGTLAASASCTVSVNVQGTTGGVKNNSVTVTSANAGTGNTSNASITVVSPPVIIKAFGAASVPLNGSTSLAFTIQNNNPTTTLTGVGFSDTLPAGLVVSTPNGLTGSCGGGTITATAGSNVISLSGASLPASSSCTFSVNVTGVAAGQQNNTTGNVTSTEGGTGGTASASLAVVAPPSIAKVFNPNTIALNATTSLTFTITNPAANTVALAGVAFSDTLPAGLTVASGTAAVCGGTLTTTNPTSIVLSGASIAPNSQCQFSVTVTGAASGQYTNTTGNVTSTNGGTGNTATANLTVASPPVIAKSFGAASILVNGTTSLSFTIQNPNSGLALTGVAFTDNLPAGLVVASPPSLSNTCGGTATAVAGSSTVSLSAGTLAANASCTVSVKVTGTTAGVKNNSVTVSAANAGTGNTSNASLAVVGPPVLMKAFGAASIPLNGTTSLTFTVQNNNPTTTLTGISFFDVLPLGLVISFPNGLTGSCDGGTIIALPGTNFISLSGATLNASSSCTFSINVKGVLPGTKHNTTSHVTSKNGGTGEPASASIDVVAPPSISKDFDPDKIEQGYDSVLSFTIVNPYANDVALTGVAFTDNLPTNITVATPNGLIGSCGGGTITATAGSGSISLTGGTIPARSSCRFRVKVTGSVPGNYTNTTGVVTSSNGGAGNRASDKLSIKH